MARDSKARMSKALDALIGTSEATEQEQAPAQAPAQVLAQVSAQALVQEGAQGLAQVEPPIANIPAPREQWVRFHFWGPVRLKEWTRRQAAALGVPEAEVLRHALEWYAAKGPLTKDGDSDA